MSWRRNTGVALLAIIGSGYCLQVTLRAQDELPAAADTQLPALRDQLDSIGNYASEELPPIQPDRLAPQIDVPADEELPPSRAGTPLLDATLDGPSGMTLDDSAFADGDDGAADRADESDAEIVPQETIRERYENGRVKIERGVAQDDRENYVNHGPWRMWNEQGNLVAEGAYRNGQRDGKWVRWYQPNEGEIFAMAPFNLFSGPFVSRATFRDGELTGSWVITDQADLKICEWNFLDGRRHGESVWYYHTGRKMRVIHYQHGEIHGELLEWDVNGNPVTRVQYEDGRRHEPTVQNYPNGQKKIEGTVLQARLIMKAPDDWWEAKMATYTAKGKDQKHGEWTAWYSNGQKRFTGHYEWDEPSGDFTWWHENGQKSLQAYYEQGMKQGQWKWWHPNGQKSIEGQYRNDSPVDRWVWWHETGKVAQRIDFSQANSPVANGVGVTTESVKQAVRPNAR